MLGVATEAELTRGVRTYGWPHTFVNDGRIRATGSMAVGHSLFSAALQALALAVSPKSHLRSFITPTTAVNKLAGFSCLVPSHPSWEA